MTPDGTYAYFGDIALVEGPRFVGVLDPGLPSWVRGRVEDMLARFFDYYERRVCRKQLDVDADDYRCASRNSFCNGSHTRRPTVPARKLPRMMLIRDGR
jgi:hypothetical protein